MTQSNPNKEWEETWTLDLDNWIKEGAREFAIKLSQHLKDSIYEYNQLGENDEWGQGYIAGIEYVIEELLKKEKE